MTTLEFVLCVRAMRTLQIKKSNPFRLNRLCERVDREIERLDALYDLGQYEAEKQVIPLLL